MPAGAEAAGTITLEFQIQDTACLNYRDRSTAMDSVHEAVQYLVFCYEKLDIETMLMLVSIRVLYLELQSIMKINEN